MIPIIRGELLLADFGNPFGSEQAYIRPCVVVSNDIENKFGPTVVVIPFTTQQKRKDLPSNVDISSSILLKKSLALTNQIRTVDKKRIIKTLGYLESSEFERIEQRLRQVLSLF